MVKQYYPNTRYVYKLFAIYTCLKLKIEAELFVKVQEMFYFYINLFNIIIIKFIKFLYTNIQSAALPKWSILEYILYITLSLVNYSLNFLSGYLLYCRESNMPPCGTHFMKKWTRPLFMWIIVLYLFRYGIIIGI